MQKVIYTFFYFVVLLMLAKCTPTPKGEIEIGLPLETEEIYYLIKMPKTVVQDDDDDFDNSDSGGGTDDFENFDNLQIADDMSDDDE